MMQSMTEPMRPAARGFTLIEVMVVVVVIGILAAVAYPAYTDSLLKGRRAEGRSALTELLQQQERYLTQTGSYMTFAAGATGANGTTRAGAGATIPFRTTSSTNSGSSSYDMAAAACSAASGALALNECVELSAVPRRSDPQAGTLTMRSTGSKGCTGTKTSVCWK